MERPLSHAIRREFLQCLSFLTILPVGAAAAEAPDFSRAARAFPLVGAVIGACGGIVLIIATGLGLSPLVAALLGVGTTIVLTGALHEDGLADTIDGFGGGRTASERLEIMRDSRIGTFGVLALIGSVALRILIVADWLPESPWQAAMALVAAETVGRAAMVWLWASLPAARADGLAASLGAPDAEARGFALLIAAILGFVGAMLAAGVLAAFVALAAAALAIISFADWSRKRIGGQTGDVLGAGQQIAVAVFLLALAAFS